MKEKTGILFRNLGDYPKEDLITACLYFIQFHDFEIDDLPTNLREEVENLLINKLKEDSLFGVEDDLIYEEYE